MLKIILVLGCLVVGGIVLMAGGSDAIVANPIVNTDSQVPPRVYQSFSFADSQMIPQITLPPDGYQDGYGFVPPQKEETPEHYYQDGYGFMPPQKEETPEHYYQDGWGYFPKEEQNWITK